MKNFKSIVLIIAFLTIGTAIKLSAQNRPEETASARAAYGNMLGHAKHNAKKKHKSHKNNKQAKANKDKSPADKRRSNWAG
jgi:hypothetical protein